MPAVNIPVLLLIVAASVLSTVASLGGGLVLYFQSLSSLEKIVSETSESEVAGLRGKILGVLADTRSNSVMNMHSSLLYAASTNDSRQWMRDQEVKGFASVRGKGLYSDTTILVPHTDRDGVMRDPSFMLSIQWGDPLRDGTTRYYTSGYGGHMASTNFIVNGSNVKSIAQANELSDGGVRGAPVFSMNVAYHTRSLGTWKPGDLNPPAGFERAAPPFVVSRWREAMLWFASADRHIYVYGSFDAVLAPPPPPHPWSGYRAIFKITQFLYSTWDEPLREYALRAEPGTHVVVYDSVKNVVFASTQGGDRVSQDCSRSDIFLGMSKSPCAFRLANLTATLRDGALSMLGEPRGKLLTKELDGVDHFVRCRGM